MSSSSQAGLLAEIVGCVDELNTARSAPITRIGVGIHTGDVVTGNVGSASPTPANS